MDTLIGWTHILFAACTHGGKSCFLVSICVNRSEHSRGCGEDRGSHVLCCQAAVAHHLEIQNPAYFLWDMRVVLGQSAPENGLWAVMSTASRVKENHVVVFARGCKIVQQQQQAVCVDTDHQLSRHTLHTQDTCSTRKTRQSLPKATGRAADFRLVKNHRLSAASLQQHLCLPP